MAYIPTAAHAEEGFGVWESGGSWQVTRTLCSDINVIKLEDYRNDSVLEELQKYDVIWLAGGFPGYLMYWLMLCRIDIHIQSLLSEKVYVGISAGSTVAGTSLSLMKYYKGGNIEPPAEYMPGLGLLDKEFYPHFNIEDKEVIEEQCERDTYLVPDGEFITIENNIIKPSAGVDLVSPKIK